MRAVGVKMAVVGGGSTYTPELVEGFACAETCCRSTSWCCTTSTRTGSDVVGGLAGRILGKRGFPGRLTLTDRPRRARRGRGLRAWSSCGSAGRRRAWSDETIPLRFGCIGQETTGPGGFAKALRTVPVVLEIAEETAPAGRAGRLVRGFHEPRRAS